MAKLDIMKKKAQQELNEWAQKSNWASKRAKAWLEKAKKAQAKGTTVGKIKAGFYNFAAKVMKSVYSICVATKNKLAAIWKKILGLVSKEQKLDNLMSKVKQGGVLSHKESKTLYKELKQYRKAKQILVQQLKKAEQGKLKISQEGKELIKQKIAQIDIKAKETANILRKNMIRRTR